MLESLSHILLGSILATPLLLLNVKVAPRLGLIDWPKARGLTEDQIPIVGHSMVLISLACLALGYFYYSVSPWFVVTATVIAIMGHFDDRKPLPALDKMFFQMVCVAAIVLFDPNISTALTAKYGPWGTFWGMLFILGLVNAVNFIDGIDGLAGLVISIGALGFLFYADSFDQFPGYTIYAGLLIGMMLPFLYLNVFKRKGFLGNIGSYFFSYMLAVMHLSLPIDSPTTFSRLSLSGLCFMIPVSDAIVVCLSRILSGRSPFQADKGHLHHRLIQASIALRYILLNFGLIELAALSMGYFILNNDGARNSWLPLYAGLSHVSITAILIVLIEKASKRRLQGYLQRLDSNEPIYFMRYKFRNEAGQPPTKFQMARLEARVSAEIRVTDLCFSESDDTLFLTLRTLPEPLRRISNRLDQVFRSEKIKTVEILEEGEFIKAPTREPLPIRTLSQKHAS